MKQLIIGYRNGANDMYSVIIPQRFRVYICVADSPSLEISIADDEDNELVSTFLPVSQEDYPILQELSYEDWETHFDEDFTDYIVSDICNYLHTGRYYDDEDTMYRAYFDFDYYEKHWTDFLKWVIDRHREECARDNNDQ